MDSPPMSTSKEFYARLFVYAAASIFTGSGMLLFLQTMQVLMERGSWQGAVSWLLLAATWANLTFLYTRRFVEKSFGYRWYPALIPGLIFLPLPVFMLLRDDAMDEMATLIVVPLALAACFFGYRIGLTAGEKRRAAR
jgi:hypothetical protein